MWKCFVCYQKFYKRLWPYKTILYDIKKRHLLKGKYNYAYFSYSRKLRLHRKKYILCTNISYKNHGQNCFAHTNKPFEAIYDHLIPETVMAHF